MDKLSYALGLGIGQQLKSMGTREDVNIDDFAQAIKDVLDEKPLAIQHTEAQQIVNAYFQKMESRMNAEKAEKGKKALEEGKQFLAENAKKEGVTTTASGLQYEVLSEGNGKRVRGAHGITLEADFLFAEADYEDCEMIVLPGGMPGALNLRDHQGLSEKIRDFASAGKPLAAICAAPLVFGSLGILAGRKATIYPGMEKELKGAEALDFPVVRDENIITAQGPAAAMKFAIALVKFFKGEKAGEELEADLLM